MKRDAVDSEALKSVGYDATRRVLEVEFEGGDVYRYFNVPTDAYDSLIAAESMGTWFNQTFKGLGFEHQRIDEA